MLLVASTLNMKVMVIKTKHYRSKISYTIRPYLSNMINDIKTQGKYKI